MPLIKRDEPIHGFVSTPPETIRGIVAPRPFSQVLEAAYENSSIHSVSRILARPLQDVVRDTYLEPEIPDDPDFDAFEHIKGFENVSFLFINAQNLRQVEEIKESYMEGIERQQIIEEAGFTGFIATIMAEAPSAAVPLGTAFAGARAGAAIRGLALGTGAAAIGETARQLEDLSITIDESLTNIGTGGLMNGIFAGLTYRPKPQVIDDFSRDYPLMLTDLEKAEMTTGSSGRGDLIVPGSPSPQPKTDGPVTPGEPGRPEGIDDLTADITPDETGQARSAGSARPESADVPGRQFRIPTDEEALRNLELEDLPTGFKWLARIPDAPFKWIMTSPSLVAREVATFLVESPYLHKGAREGRVLGASVESNIRTWTHGLVSAVRGTGDSYIKYRGLQADAGITEIAGMAAKDLFRGRDGFMSRADFNKEVGKAMRNADNHPITEVATAAKAWRKVVDELRDTAHDLDLFTHGLRRNREGLEAELKAAKAGKLGRQRETQLKTKIDDLTRQIDDITANGPKITTAASYFPRIWRNDVIMANLTEFTDIVEAYLRNIRGMPARAGGRTGETSREAADNIVEGILATHQRSRISADDLGGDRALHARSFDIPDHLVEKFLESDVEMVMKSHHRQMVADIELSRAFPEGFDLKETIQRIKDDFDEKIAKERQRATKTGDNPLIAQLIRQKQRDVDIVRAFRDRIRGTYGMPNDPNRPLSRGMRLMMQYNSMTMLGGAMISSMPDVARPMMVEGFSRTMGNAIQPLLRDLSTLKMSIKELQLAGTAFDIELNTRAMAMADMNDMFLRGSSFERGMQRATSAFFLANGLSVWNQTWKGVSGMVVMSRIIQVSRQIKAGKKVSKADKNRMSVSLIDDDMAKRIADQFELHGQEINGAFVPHTDMWGAGAKADPAAAMAFRRAVAADVDRIIVTPGVGDRPLWTSSEWGRMGIQFKSFGMASVQRVLIPALQTRDRETMNGVMLLLGMGLIVDQLKRAQFGDTRERTMQEAIADGVERSGLFGWLADANNVAERLSNNNVGFRPTIGASPPFESSMSSKIGSVLGPSASQIDNLYQIGDDFLSGEDDHWTVRARRRAMPGNTLFYLDWGFDQIERAAR